jgi:enamine deaminase RidA (YjgF/YER057c/UK114 family)
MPHVDQVVKRLETLGIRLPEAPKPVAAYVPWVRSDRLLYVSGQIPFRDGGLLATGPVPSATSLEAAQQAARQCALNGLAVAADALDGRLDRVRRVVRIGVFVACDPGFEAHPQVANGASEFLIEVFGEAGRHARAAVGSPSLPRGATVEVELLFEVD